MESNIKIKDTPKLKISSAVFGDKDIAGDSTGSIRNIHKTLSKLSGHVRKSLIRIKGLEEKFSKVEKKIEVNSEKITRIKKVLQTQKGNIGKKLPGGSNVNQSLVETNRILVEIQKQITTAFGMRNEEEKEKNKTLKQEKSKEKLRLKEGVIESVRKIGGAIKKTAQFVAAPFKGFFDKILEFITLLGLGIGANAVFKWLEDEENRKKMSKFFNIIVSNWKLIRNILGLIAGIYLGAKIIALGSAIAGLAGPLAILAAAAGLVLATATSTSEFDQVEGENAVYNDPRLGEGKSFEVERPDWDFGGVFTRMANTQEKKEARARESIVLIEGVSGGRKFEEWSPDKQKKYNEAIAFLKLDKNKMLARISNAPDNRPGALPENLDGFRAMGGPVTAGKQYLVGEKGPEIFAPNVDGSIINNMRTEKIYQMISSKDAGKINFITMELPPKVMKKEQQDSTQQTAPPVPSISPVNGSNPYMNTTPEIYGIYV